MTDLKNRENTFENKFAHDAETLFRIESRAAKLLGLWAAQEMGITGDEAAAYAATVVSSNLKQSGVSDVTSKVSADMAAKGRATTSVETMMRQFMKDAEQQVQAQ